MKIANLKISLHFKQPFFEKKRGNQKIISKVKTWTMTQYTHSPQLVNLTGLKSWDEISQATQTIEDQFQNKCINSQVDCCMISHKGNKSVDLVKLYTELKRVWEEDIALTDLSFSGISVNGVAGDVKYFWKQSVRR